MNPSVKNWISDRWNTNPLLFLLGVGVLILPLSNAIGQIPIYVASVCWLVTALRSKETVHKGTLFWIGGFAVIILLSITYSVRPMNGVDKLNRLLLFPLVLAIPSFMRREPEPVHALRALLLSFCAGVCLLGVFDLIRVPIQVAQGMELFDTGNMTSPQFYMVGLILCLGFSVGTGRPQIPLWGRGAMGFLMVSGLLLHNKRGAWLACVLAISCWVLVNRRWKILLAMVLVGAMGISMPQVRARLAELQEVVMPNHGGRMVLWRHVAPELIRDYPLGMGYAAPEYEDFRAVTDRHIEEGLDHLHNNLLQTRLELGWHGVLFWGSWMTVVLSVTLIRAWRVREVSPEQALAQSTVGIALLALLLNGCVEYNFGDSEILMVYLMILGAAAGVGTMELTSSEAAPRD